MTTPVTELKKLMELRDAGELSEAEYAAAKSRVLRPELYDRSRRGSLNPFATFGRGVLTIIVALGVLIGGATLLAMTEAGSIALLSLGMLALALLAVWVFKETF